MRLRKTGIVEYDKDNETYNLLPYEQDMPCNRIRISHAEAFIWEHIDGEIDKKQLIRKLKKVFIITDEKAEHTIDKFLYLLIIYGLI